MSPIPFSKAVTLVRNPGTPNEQTLTVQGTVQEERGFFPPNTPVHEGDIVETPDPRGGLQRRKVAQVKINEIGSDLDHLEIVWENPSRAGVAATIRSGAIVQNFSGPVGAVLTGDSVVANINQNVGTQASEIASLLDLVLRASSDLPSSGQQEVREQVEELRAEMAAAKPKPSRVKAYLAAMWQFTREVATVAPKVLELAEKLGYPMLPK